MNKPIIEITTRRGTYFLPNRWERLSRSSYLYVVSLLAQYTSGALSAIGLHARYVANELGIDLGKVRNEDGLSNLYTIASQVDFITRYDLQQQAYELRTPSFARQFLPRVRLCGQTYRGYRITLDSGVLSTDLTALEFLDAMNALRNPDALPLLAMILYRPDRRKPYDADTAVALAAEIAPKLKRRDYDVLLALSIQFSAFATFLMRVPAYRPLMASGHHQPKREDALIESSHAALYALCRDGIGSSSEVEQMNILKYLDMLSDKLIGSVRELHAAGLDAGEIANKTHLPIDIITRII